MQKEKKSSSIRLLLQWAGKEKYWMYLAVILSFFSGICTMIPYYGIYSLMSAVYTGTCTTEFVIRDAGIIAGGIVIRFLLFGASGVASHKGAYRALLKVRCMVIDHMAKVPLGALNERSTGEIKTVLNEDIAASDTVYSPDSEPSIVEQNGRYFRVKGDSVYPITNFIIRVCSIDL